MHQHARLCTITVRSHRRTARMLWALAIIGNAAAILAFMAVQP